MTRDRLASYARATGTVLLGTALLYAIGRYLGWYVVGAIAVIAIGDLTWCKWQLARRLPTRRPW